MRHSGRYARVGVAVGAVLAIAGCAPPSTSGAPSTAATATSAAALGGMDALVAAAKKEGQLNLVSTAPDWANYAAIMAGFQAKYGIKINDDNPEGSSQDEINAVKRLAGTDRAPDALDIGVRELADTSLFAPYQVATWKDIPDAQKEPSGLWVQDYGGYMAIGYDSSKVSAITSVQDLLKPEFKGKIALFADPTASNSALSAVMMTSLANGGSLDDISKGVEFFAKLKKAGNFVPVAATKATVANGTTPVVINWDYLAVSFATDVPAWTLLIPSGAIVAGFYNQAVNKGAPHPAAARLWMEYLYSNEGQNLFLEGGARPVRMDAMTKQGVIDAPAAAKLPPVSGPGNFINLNQATAAKAYLVANWANAIS
ncbi:extracellular solute-binding protein [bacterium]|nr:MAG: extracellular solute-binding protein [bacterium]